MSSRHRSRERALQILFQWDVRKQPVDDALDAFYDTLSYDENEIRLSHDSFIDALVKGTVEKVAEIDNQITRHAEHWRIERMPTVDRNILRLAVYELLNTETPAPVVIDEALELARRFSNEESVQFVNGVLDAVHRQAGQAPAQ